MWRQAYTHASSYISEGTKTDGRVYKSNPQKKPNPTPASSEIYLPKEEKKNKNNTNITETLLEMYMVTVGKTHSTQDIFLVIERRLESPLLGAFLERHTQLKQLRHSLRKVLEERILILRVPLHVLAEGLVLD